jgi:IS5 family transposase
MVMQSSFSELEYASKKKVTRRDRFLRQINAVTPWAELIKEIEPFYPRGEGPGRPPIGLERMLRMYIVSNDVKLTQGIGLKLTHPAVI